MDCRASVVWDEGYLAYDFGAHPMNPVRLEFTIDLARSLGVLDRVEMIAPVIATDDDLLRIHGRDYLNAVRTASSDSTFTGFGLGTDDDPVFQGMYDASALIAGGSLRGLANCRAAPATTWSTSPAGCTTRCAIMRRASACSTTSSWPSANCSTPVYREWPTWMSTCTTATAFKPRSTTTRGC